MNLLELLGYVSFLLVAWGHGFFTGVPYGAWRSNRETTPNVRLSCPSTGAVVATEDTQPVRWENRKDGHSVAVYACSECGGRHRFLWGPPAPVRLADADPPTDEETGWTPDDGAGYIPAEERWG